MALTGIFPVNKEINVPSSPLKLLKCHRNLDCCGLVQLDSLINQKKCIMGLIMDINLV